MWRELLPTGPAPLPRYDHVAALFPVSPNAQQPTKLLILGGRDSVQQFRDAHVLDLETLTWDTQHSIPALSHEVRGCSGGGVGCTVQKPARAGLYQLHAGPRALHRSCPALCGVASPPPCAPTAPSLPGRRAAAPCAAA